jgi:hypothetical protein
MRLKYGLLLPHQLQQQGLVGSFWLILKLDCQKLDQQDFYCVSNQNVWPEEVTVTVGRSGRLALVRAQSGQNETALRFSAQCRPSSLFCLSSVLCAVGRVSARRALAMFVVNSCLQFSNMNANFFRQQTCLPFPRALKKFSFNPGTIYLLATSAGIYHGSFESDPFSLLS